MFLLGLMCLVILVLLDRYMKIMGEAEMRLAVTEEELLRFFGVDCDFPEHDIEPEPPESRTNSVYIPESDIEWGYPVVYYEGNAFLFFIY